MLEQNKSIYLNTFSIISKWKGKSSNKFHQGTYSINILYAKIYDQIKTSRENKRKKMKSIPFLGSIQECWCPPVWFGVKNKADISFGPKSMKNNTSQGAVFFHLTYLPLTHLSNQLWEYSLKLKEYSICKKNLDS